MTDPGELVLNGVRYADLEDGAWRLGSTIADWRQDLAGAGSDPAAQVLARLAARGIWLHRATQPPPLALMCCGMGSSWPGMGRELYDNFPAARAAMDRVAECASWDVLSLLDQTDPEVINQIRYQIPYLFLVEYAQWSVLTDLGLKPALICGHSLGELVALCLAGVYSPEAAWYLLETRAANMATLEERATQGARMLALSADWDVVQDLLRANPDIHISNRNTVRQYVLSGPEQTLAEIRKSLRRARIPAFFLPLHLAFHNPAMQVLRDISYRRLNGLTMQPAAVPMLSCVSATLYPGDRPGICRTITELDENTVDWVRAVETMRDSYKIGFFLELGPADTLCGLVSETYPAAQVASASRKGHEVQAMRELCARLYSLGYLSRGAIAARAACSGMQPAVAVAPPECDWSGWESPEAKAVLELVARASGRPAAELNPALDLRYDLALRSSAFPALVQEAEETLGRGIDLENLFQVTTLGDLLNLFLGSRVVPASLARQPLPLDIPSRFAAPALARMSSPAHEPLPLPWPAPPQSALKPGDLLAAIAFDGKILPWLCPALLSAGVCLLVPDDLVDQCGKRADAELVQPLGWKTSEPKAGLVRALKARRLAGLVLVWPQEAGQEAASLEELAAIGEEIPWIWVLAPRQAGAQTPDPLAALRKIWPDARLIHWLAPGEPGRPGLYDAGDRLACEALYGRAANVAWLPEESGINWQFCPDATLYRSLLPVSQRGARAGQRVLKRDFSIFAEPALARHGAWVPFPLAADPQNFLASPWVPLSGLIDTFLDTASLMLPWLQATALSDIVLAGFPALPAGITRECLVEASLALWIPQEGQLTRVCSSEISCRQLTENGRHTAENALVASGACLCSRFFATPEPLWPCQSFPAGEAVNPDLLYDQLGIAPPWRALESGRAAGAGEFEFAVRSASVAQKDQQTYSGVAYMLDAVFQAAILALLQAGEDLKRFLWRPAGIGYVRFVDPLLLAKSGNVLQLRRTWHNASFRRFDAQLLNDSGDVLLILQHLEFDKNRGREVADPQEK